MARVKRSQFATLAVAALYCGAATLCLAQSAPSQPGSLTVRLTDLRSAPLSGITIILRNVATGVESRTTTTGKGSYRFPSLPAGEYTIEAESPEHGASHLDGIVVSSGHESRVQAAIELEHAPAVHALATAPALNHQNSAPPAIATSSPAESTLPHAVAPGPTTPELVSAPAVPVPQVHAPAPPAQQIAAIPRQPLTALSPEPTAASTQPSIAAALPHIANPTHAIASTIAATAAAAGLQAVLHAHIPQLAPLLASAQNPDPGTIAATSTISATEMQSLPATGRHWQDFLPGIPASSSPGSLRTAGQDSTGITIDGLSSRLAFGQSALAEPRTQDSGPSNQTSYSTTWSNARAFTVSEIALREVQYAGARINIETERGGNQFHGQAFFFDRQNNWGARNPFTQWIQNAGSSTAPVFTPQPYTPPDHETILGFGVGAPIRRNKLFWFAAIDSSRRNDPGLSTVKYPAEFFFLPTPNDAQIQLLAARLGESENQAYNDYLGVNTNNYAPAGLEQLAGLLGPAPRTASQWTGFARIDWQLADRHRLMLEGTGSNWSSPGGGLSRVSETYGSHSFGSSTASQQRFQAQWQAFVTPNLLATTQASIGRSIFTAHPAAPSSFEQTMLAGNAWGRLPQIVVDSRYGFTIGNPSRFGQGSYPDEHLYHAQQMLDWAHDSLLLRAGFEAAHNSDATTLLRNQTGTYYYSKVQNFISDALAFEKFGLSDALDYASPHNCGVTTTSFGPMPCYSYYRQTMGPNNWQLSTTDIAGFATAQWQAGKRAVFSAGLRWDREALPPPLAALSNPELPLTQKLPSLGSNWGPRLSLALGSAESRWPVLRLGYGLYYGRTQNATLETALTQTGSLKGDLSFFMRPTDDCQFCAGGAPPFPHVFTGEPSSIVKPGAVEFAPTFRNPEVHQAIVSLEQSLPGHVQLTASAVASLGRRLPISVDTNFNPAVNPKTITYAVIDASGRGPIKSPQITVPFYASWPSPTGLAGRLNPDYQQITEIFSRANSTYEAAMLRVTRYSRRGLTFHAHYTYAHAMDWNPNNSTLVAGSDVLDPASFRDEYGTSNLDVRHSAAAFVIYESPWKLHDRAGRLANGWMLSAIGHYRSGFPYTMRTSGSLPEEFVQTSGASIVGLGPGMNGSGGDNRVYGLGSDGRSYNIGRNTFRYPAAWKADLRLGKRFDLGHMRSLQLLAESFNLFNHQNVTELETTGYYIDSGSTSSLPTLNFLTGLRPNSTPFGQPLNINATDFYRERQIQLGLRLTF